MSIASTTTKRFSLMLWLQVLVIVIFSIYSGGFFTISSSQAWAKISGTGVTILSCLSVYLLFLTPLNEYEAIPRSTLVFILVPYATAFVAGGTIRVGAVRLKRAMSDAFKRKSEGEPRARF